MLNENRNRKRALDGNREKDELNMTASENDLREWKLDSEVFKNLFETMAEGVVYHNSTGKIITANPSAERILGLTLSQMQKRSPTDPEWKMIHEDGTPIPGEEYPVIKALKNGKPVYGKIIGFYPPKEKKEHWLKINAIPQYRKGEEEPYQVYTSFEDITQEIETQRALKQSQKELNRSLQEKDKKKRHLEAMHEIAVDVLDSADFLETATKLFSDCKKLTGATSGYVSLLNEAGDENEVLYLDSGGDDCMVDPTLPMPTRGLRGVAFRSGEAEYHNDFMHSQHRQYMPAGHVALNNVLFAPLKNQEKVVGFLGLGNKEGGFTEEDAQTAQTVAKFVSIALLKSQLISQLKKERETAQKANRAKSAFLASMSHELRTPLNGIIGYSDILRTTPLEEEQKNFLNIVFSSAKHLSEVISDILDFSKIEAGKLELFPEKTDLRKLIDETCSIVGFRGELKGLALTHSVVDRIPQSVMVDSPRLRQILVNLLTNAVKFTDEGSVQLEVSLQERQLDKARLLFKVTDTGMGIKEKDWEKIFVPFYQGDMSTSKKSEGTGLGLAITKDLLKNMGSALELKSTFGEGSTFYFELLLPCEKEDPGDSNQPDAEITIEASTFKNKKVLIVEDNFVNMNYTQTAIAMFSKDIQIIAAENGEEAYNQYQEHNPDLILMDIVMPESDGYQATKMIRKLDPQVPIIAITAMVQKEDKEACLAAGMNEYISKPFYMAQLKEILKKHL